MNCPHCGHDDYEFVYETEKKHQVVRCCGCRKLYTIFPNEPLPHHNED